jgi:hypothetical protein
MKKELILVIALVCALTFAGSALAQPPFTQKWQATYDAYLDEDIVGAVLADTLIVVNNSHNVNAMPVYIEVFDKHGNPLGEGYLYNGGSVVTTAPVNGYVWVTIGMIVGRPTQDPWGSAGGEKFRFRVSSGLTYKPPIIEVKQVIYNTRVPYPGEAIWQPANIKTWAETCLGGLKGPGITRVPKKMQW